MPRERIQATHTGFCLILVLAVTWILPEALGRQKMDRF